MDSPLVKAESLKEQIFKLMKNRILNNELAGEEILNERTISQELSVSRTPVREALKALEAEGWVEYVPYKGVVVKKMTHKDLRDIFEIRRALEVLMVECALPYITDATLSAMEESMQAQLVAANANDIKAFSEADAEFHNILLRATTNEMLKKSIADLRDKIRTLGMNSLFSGTDRFGETLTEHQKLLDALKSRDVNEAKTSMDRHIQRVYETASQHVSKKQGKAG